MYQVLIVDDERILREGLARHIPWAKHEMDVIGTAANVDEALRFFAKQPVDILITDIKMPVKSGFDLIRNVTEQGYTPQVILVSSYNEFVYAQQACVLDLVCDYILKPVDIPAFENTLLRTRQRLQKQQTPRTVFNTREYLSLLNLVDEIHFDRRKFAQELADPDKSIAAQTWRTVSDTLAQSSCALDTLQRFCSNLLLQVESEFQNHAFGNCTYLKHMPEIYEELAKIQSHKALFQFMQHQITTIGSCAHENPSGKSPLILAAVSKLKKNYTDINLNLASMAAALNVSPNYLSLKFREETGMPFTKYLTDFRLACARELLSDPKHRIATVSAMVGFSDEKYFIRVFKAETGITPKKYQQTHYKK